MNKTEMGLTGGLQSDWSGMAAAVAATAAILSDSSTASRNAISPPLDVPEA